MAALVCIDSRVSDPQLLLSSLPAASRVVCIDEASSGLAQIARALQGHSGLEAIHIVSHGSDGALHLGRTTLERADLDAHAADLAMLGRSLADDGAILLYGCNLARTALGRDFVRHFAELSGAHVAASRGLTGHAALGGDWALEERTGAIRAPVFASPLVQALYPHTLVPPPVSNLNLSALNGTNGFSLAGVNAFDTAGYSISNAGDLNGDGFDDLVIGALGFDRNPYNTYSGAGYVVFGAAGGFQAGTNLSSLNGTNGMRLLGTDSADRAGYSVSGAGDFNGDGIADLLIGAPSAEGATIFSGGSYVVFGTQGGFPATTELSTLNGSNGFMLSGTATQDRAGASVRAAGDVNGDGLDDIVIGAYGANANGGYSGSAYVVFGRVSGTASNLMLSALDGTNGFKLSGAAASDQAGKSVSAAGDINGDGFDDLLVGAPGVNGNAGAAYLVFGKASGFAANLELSALDGLNGLRLTGSGSAGYAVSSAGDVNGDGFDDLMIGANSDGSSFGGVTYVVFGKASGYLPGLDLATLDGNNGFKLSGAAAGDKAGFALSSVGDVNGDGYGDILVGARLAQGEVNRAGAAYLLFGHASGFAASLNLGALDGLNGVKLSGTVQFDGAGQGVGGGGDLNGDGFDDLLVGASGADPNGVDRSGAGYLVFGGVLNFTTQVNFLTGASADSPTGTSAAETFVSGAGNDTVTGGGGADAVHAGAGEDRIVVADTGFLLVDGGSGVDTLALAGAGMVLDLTTLPNNRISDIEVIDIRGSGTNALRLSASDLFDLSSTSNTLWVDKDADDLFLKGVGWAFTGTNFTNGKTYASYTLGQATLNVVADVAPSSVSVLNGLNGFRIPGLTSGSANGYTVDSAGDVNHDGFADFLVGAFRADVNGANSGASYLAFGTAARLGSSFDLAGLDGNHGIKLSGAVGAATSGFPVYSGFSVSSAGDINGDGFDDVLVSAVYADPGGRNYAGASYVVFGKASGFPAELNLSSVDGFNGFQIGGVAPGDYSGWSVSTAGDVNGDGFDDVIIGARQADPHGESSGEAYVVFGKASGFGSNVDLSTLAGGNGFKMSGVAASDGAGGSVCNAGDVNGDGFDDMLIGAPFTDFYGNDRGTMYIVYGKSAGFSANMELSFLNGVNGSRIIGEDGDDQLGFSVSSAGDVNGDGYADVIVGAPGALGAQGHASGAAYLLFGAASGISSFLSVTNLTGAGFKLAGGIELNGDQLGASVGSAGDFNGDGFGDVIVGARQADPNGLVDAGAAYVVYGRASFAGSSMDLSALDGSNGFRIDGGSAGDNAGWSVAGAGDLNGDGFDDLIVGAISTDINANNAGGSYVIYGGNFSGAVRYAGSSDADTLSGSNSSESFVTGSGADSIHSLLGNDTIRAGAGSDTVDAGEGNDRIEGDTGDDSLSGAIGFDTIYGGDGNDRINGANNADQLYGGDGNDSLFGGKSADMLSGGNGDDVLSGQVGNDSLYGGNGRDTADYGAGDAVTVNLATGVGGSTVSVVGVFNGTDILLSIENVIGSAFADSITGDLGINVLTGGSGNDTLSSSDSPDTLFGGDGDDMIAGGAGGDSILGGIGNDNIGGGKGGDRIFGEDGDDTLNGNLGNDQLTGGAGADKFVFNAVLSVTTNVDTILDFQAGTDAIQLSASIFTTFNGQIGQTVGPNTNLLYDNGTGVLSYDGDGAGGAAATAFAILGNGTHPGGIGNDFLIVA